MPTSTAATKLQTDLLIIGAGPFGICLAAHAQHNALDYLMVGVPMEFWKQNMPEGMYLRSACDWHLDADGEHTIEYFLAQQQLSPEAVEPLSLEFYLSYVQWFLAQKQLNNLPVYVQQLDRESDGSFTALLQDGSLVEAQRVAIAVGFKYFVNLPEELTNRLPSGHYVHTCDFVELNQLEGKSCLILGGRQSAFEWAALLAEAEAKAIHLAYRHETPAFVEADWSWVNTIVDGMEDNPGWYRHLSDDEKKEVSYRLWAEGRLKLEPWLKDRITNEQVHLWPQSQVATTALLPNGKVLVTLDSGAELEVDQIILATGYKADVERIPFLQKGNLLPQLAIQDGFPELDETFQTNVPGLYITSLPAGRDFGPFFGFTVSVRVATKLIGRGLLQRQFA